MTSLNSKDVPWKSLNINTDLDLIYYGNRSGNKIISPLLEKMTYDNDGYLTADSMSLLASAIYARYNDKWSMLYTAYDKTFDPSKNYYLTETKTGDDTKVNEPEDRKTTRTETPTDWKLTRTDTPTDWITESSAEDDNNITTSSETRYGFNSSEAVPLGGSETSVNAKTSTEQKGTYQTEDERTGTYQTEDEISGTITDTTTYNTTLTREGSTDYLDTIEKTRAFWLATDFFDIVFADIDKILTISTY